MMTARQVIAHLGRSDVRLKLKHRFSCNHKPERVTVAKNLYLPILAKLPPETQINATMGSGFILIDSMEKNHE